ncbi:putative D-amino acid oxidase [Mytilinidion resinicola]|uniref:D-amino acid oxidase n=1 Tax=Mytilinidion resinicola TaxID=574789 RepID=A0A6A6Y0P8_9PEZI|nr:putative D-amino acid oxidase [Mytilinidion resinicola]KAF2802220.1 putative D-amino acid oxidase [Mytilinidion resinicola]
MAPQPHIRLWEDITPLPKPLWEPTLPRVLVIGGGVSGLVTSWVLLDAGYPVTILASEYAIFTGSRRLTSQIAGALWEYPPAVCGAHTDPISLQSSKRWCMESYHCYSALAAFDSAATGVSMKTSIACFPHPIAEDPVQVAKVAEMTATDIQDFRRDNGALQNVGVNMDFPIHECYSHLAPVIDTDRAMAWLASLVKSKGATMLIGTISGDLIQQEKALLTRFSAAAIVNASGLGSRGLGTGSTCYPLRGALLRVRNDGTDFPKLTAALSISADSSEDNEIVFLVPRGEDTLLLGGLAQPNEASLDLTLDSPVIKRMRERCEKFLPVLKKAKLVEGYPLAQGLRPFRKGNVRVARQSRTVHNYGHGGSGWSLAFGCALDVKSLIGEVVGIEGERVMSKL